MLDLSLCARPIYCIGQLDSASLEFKGRYPLIFIALTRFDFRVEVSRFNAQLGSQNNAYTEEELAVTHVLLKPETHKL